MNSRLIGLGLSLVVIVGILSYKFSLRSDQAAEFRDQIHDSIRSLPDYDSHGALYDEWFDQHHEQIFNRHYHIGGRRSAPRFDGAAYLDELLPAMIAEAMADGYAPQAEHLRACAETMTWSSD